jgi:hypothetical protein
MSRSLPVMWLLTMTRARCCAEAVSLDLERSQDACSESLVQTSLVRDACEHTGSQEMLTRLTPVCTIAAPAC